MKYNLKTVTNNRSVPIGILTGIGTSLLLLIIGAALVSYLIHREAMSENKIPYCVMGLLMLSSYVGAAASCRKATTGQLLVSCLCGGCYFLILLLWTVVFFGGKFTGVGVTGLIILCGAVLASLPKKENRRVGKRRKIKIHGG